MNTEILGHKIVMIISFVCVFSKTKTTDIIITILPSSDLITRTDTICHHGDIYLYIINIYIYIYIFIYFIYIIYMSLMAAQIICISYRYYIYIMFNIHVLYVYTCDQISRSPQATKIDSEAL